MLTETAGACDRYCVSYVKIGQSHYLSLSMPTETAGACDRYCDNYMKIGQSHYLSLYAYRNGRGVRSVL